MIGRVRLLTCIAAIAPWVLLTAAPASAGDETFTLKQIINLPNGQSLVSFDIAFDDANIHLLGFADRQNAAVDIIDTNTNKIVKQLTADPPFAGLRASPGQASGPNGVLIVGQKEVWAGDGPSSCDASGNCTHDSSIKAIDIKSGKTIATMNTGGQRRADELCEAVSRDVVLIANDTTLDNFITFWSTESHMMLGKIKLDGTDPDGKNITANGIEQCKFNPRTNMFYLNLPATAADASGPGLVLRITAEAPFQVVDFFTIPAATGCAGPTGLAIGPDHQILLGCGGTASLIIDDRTGTPMATLPGETSDEAWYNPGDNHYFLADDLKLGVVDHTGVEDATTPTANGSHVVAVDMLRNQVYVPINNNPAEGGASHICGANGGDDAKGCIAVYAAKNDDHCLTQGMPVMDHDRDDDPVFMRPRCDQDRRADNESNH